jgi:hypothetical protein
MFQLEILYSCNIFTYYMGQLVLKLYGFTQKIMALRALVVSP